MTQSLILKSHLKVKSKNQVLRKTFQLSTFKACIVIQARVTSKIKQQTETNRVRKWDSHLIQTQVSKSQKKKFTDMSTISNSHMNPAIMRNLTRQKIGTSHLTNQRLILKDIWQFRRWIFHAPKSAIVMSDDSCALASRRRCFCSYSRVCTKSRVVASQFSSRYSTLLC